MRRVGHLLSRALVPAMTTALLVSCSGQPSVGASSTDRMIVTAKPTDVGMDALATGKLGWGEAGCMGMTVGDATYLIVFPHGTSLNAQDEVVLPDGFRLREGDDVALGGGFLSADQAKGDLAELRDGCITESVWLASGDHALASAG